MFIEHPDVYEIKDEDSRSKDGDNRPENLSGNQLLPPKDILRRDSKDESMDDMILFSPFKKS